ncbi:hypothetical protein C8R45DRAFT_83958 [Mycena sanguinolenta]|nr:hypothetical protein C8R45DRAFT_83958 [Mycena sanguinolenta]
MLTDLSLQCHRAVEGILHPEIPEFPFPNVETLDVCLSSWSEGLLALQRFPAVRTLQVSAPKENLLPPTATLFPFLNDYDGPHEFLVYLDPRTTLRRLQISMCKPLSALKTMGHCADKLRSITGLALSFDCLQTTAFRPIVKSFPALVDFRMEIAIRSSDGEMYTAQSLFLELAAHSPFPHGLETIAIVWWSHPGPDGVDVIPAARGA